MPDTQLTQEIKRLANITGADLVGIAPVERWAHAPLEHSPQGIMPTARTVISCGMHFLDAPTELSQEVEIRKAGAAATEHHASSFLPVLGSRLAHELEQRGHQALVIPQSGYWSYRPSVGAERGFMADMSSYYAAVAAGLGEVGWHNICITPQFGPRVRFVTIVTDADLAADPMYEGEPLCDRCLLCAKNCPTQSFDKDVIDTREIQIGDRKFTFPYRSFWRCGLGENFQLDVLMDIPDQVDEATIYDLMQQALHGRPEIVYEWKMGMCLKSCVPPQRRYFDRDYCKSPRRRRDAEVSEDAAQARRALTECQELAAGLEIDLFGAAGADAFKQAGIDLTEYLPDARSALVLGMDSRFPIDIGQYLKRAELVLGNHLQNDYGYSVLPLSGLDANQAAVVCGLATPGAEGVTSCSGIPQLFMVSLTSLPVAEPVAHQYDRALPTAGGPEQLTGELHEIATASGAELFGVAPAARLDDLTAQLEPLYADETYFTVADQGCGLKDSRGNGVWSGPWPFNPQVVSRDPRRPQRPEDCLPGGLSVIVVGRHLLDGSIDHAGTAPAHKAGHFVEAVHSACFVDLGTVMRRVARRLTDRGYRAAVSFDLTGLASQVFSGNWDLTANRFAALAAGLGELGQNGLLLTPQFGARQRCGVIVTDAPLAYDDVYRGPALCRRCGACAGACPVQAIAAQEQQTLTVEGREFTWGKFDQLRCDCAQRYGLIAAEGPTYFESTTDNTLPAQITPEYVCQALRDSDLLQRGWYSGVVERCFTTCPAHREG